MSVLEKRLTHVLDAALVRDDVTQHNADQVLSHPRDWQFPLLGDDNFLCASFSMESMALSSEGKKREKVGGQLWDKQDSWHMDVALHCGDVHSARPNGPVTSAIPEMNLPGILESHAVPQAI